jgi:general secretion pathway protein F/type IV pilus assembly protein PilC
MPDFAYIARDMKGQQLTGTLTANSKGEALSALAGRSLFPVSVTQAKTLSANSSLKVGGQIMATTYAQMAALLRSGVPLLKAVAVIKEQTSNKNLKTILDDVYRRVEDGTPLGEAIARYPRAFSEMAVNMVRAGAEGGFLEDALERVATFTETSEDLKGRTLGAMAYPIILGVIGSSVVMFLIIFFVPYFAQIFDRLRERGELPFVTDMLLFTSDFLRAWGWIPLILGIVGIYFLRQYLATPTGRLWGDGMKLKLPVAGAIFRNFAVARFCRVLGTLLHNGVPILKALEISREAASNRVLSNAIAKASENISAGKSLAGPLGASKQFPSIVIEMVSVAEESNTLDRVLVELADGLEKRTTRQLDLFVRLLEPIMLVVLAAVVLVVVVALLVPVVKMSSAL